MDKQAQFSAGMNALLCTWPALKLAIENDQDDSMISNRKRDNLLSEILDYFRQCTPSTDSQVTRFRWKKY